jgi:TolA-binding protein
LYSEAVAARRAGRSSDALTAYERLLSRYPNGPLAESASAGRLRLLAKLDTARARSEARAYLSRYPRGMARAEAEALLGEP